MFNLNIINQGNKKNTIYQGCSQENSLPAKIFMSRSPFFKRDLEKNFCPYSFGTPSMPCYQASHLRDGGCSAWKENDKQVFKTRFYFNYFTG